MRLSSLVAAALLALSALVSPAAAQSVYLKDVINGSPQATTPFGPDDNVPVTQGGQVRHYPVLSITPGMLPDASNASLPTSPNYLLGNTTAHLYFAKAYGSCTWDSSHDVGPCINAAITAASAGSGGAVVVPAGSFGLATTIAILPQVKLVGAGGGPFGVCGSLLTWNGAVGGTMVRIGSSATTTAVVNPGIKNICLNGGPVGAGTAAVGVEQWTTNYGDFDHVNIGNITGKAWYLRISTAAPATLAGNVGNRYANVNMNLCSAAAVNADGWYIDSGTDNDDANQNTWIAGQITVGHGNAWDWGASDANWVLGGAIYPCSAGDASTGNGMVFRGSPSASSGHSRGNMIFGTSVGGGGRAGIVSTAGAAGEKAASGNILFARKTEDGQPAPTCASNPADITFTGNTHGTTTIDGIASTAGFAVGQLITGTDIPATTTRIESVAANSIVISQAATGSTVGVTFTLTQPDRAAFHFVTVDGNFNWCGSPNTLTRPNISWNLDAYTASHTVTTDEAGRFFSNANSVGAITFTLPAALASGNWYCFSRVTANQITVQAIGSDVIRLSANVASSAGGFVRTTSNASRLCLVDEFAGSWRSYIVVGTWTSDSGPGIRYGIMSGLNTIGTQLSKSNDTLATIPGMSMTLAAGVSYICNGHLSVSSSGAGGGIKVALTGDGTLSVTSMHFTAANWDGTTANARSTVTALATAAGGANAVVTDVDLAAGIVVNAGGVLSVQAAQNTTDATATVVRGTSTFGCREVD